MYAQLIEFIRDVYGTNDPIPLHAPTFRGNEKSYVNDAIDSTYVSSVGKYVDQFERAIESYTGATRAVATVNGTAALHAALYMAGVRAGDLVITQALTFVATCNAIYHLGASPIFIDVASDSLGLCPVALDLYLREFAEIDPEGLCRHRQSKQIIRAVVPMHTFGHPVALDELSQVCAGWKIELIEDAAESLGSLYNGRHTGTVGRFAALSFNGNKIITTGGGGMILARSAQDGNDVKHITTTAKVPHPYEFCHDRAGFNYRMPNLNAALGCAQLEQLPLFLNAKRNLAERYKSYFVGSEFQFVTEPQYAKSNYWLNAVMCPDASTRDELLKRTNQCNVMTRPIWRLMHKLPMYRGAIRGELNNSERLASLLVNLPSTPITSAANA